MGGHRHGRNSTPSALNVTFRKGQGEKEKEDSKIGSFEEFKREMEVMMESMFEAWQNKQKEEFEKTNDFIKDANEETAKLIDSMNKKFEEIDIKLQILEKNYKQQINYVSSLEEKIEDMQRRIQLSSLELRGLPYQKNENLREAFEKLCQTTGICINVDSICNIYRLPSKTEEKPIIVEFPSLYLRDKFISSFKTYNKDKGENMLSAASLGFSESKSLIFISEFLTRKNKRLFYLARKLATDLKYKYCWTKLGRVYLRKGSTDPYILVKSENQLNNLMIPASESQN